MSGTDPRPWPEDLLALPDLGDLPSLTPQGARELQERYRDQVVEVDRLDPPSTVAGLDVSYQRFRPRAWSGISVVRLPDLTPIEEVSTTVSCTFPYIPGLLAFREVGPVLAALRRLSARPDLLLVDGQGRAHPRRFGLACHLGLALDIPAIGCAKTRFVGTPAGPLGEAAGSTVDLVEGDEVVGVVLRTRDRVKPVYVSVGHRVSLETAVQIVRDLTDGLRLPVPARRAHQLAGAERKQDPDPS